LEFLLKWTPCKTSSQFAGAAPILLKGSKNRGDAVSNARKNSLPQCRLRKTFCGATGARWQPARRWSSTCSRQSIAAKRPLEIAAEVNTHEPSTRRLLDAMVALKYLTRKKASLRTHARHGDLPDKE
jgi:hypothetical protein